MMMMKTDNFFSTCDRHCSGCYACTIHLIRTHTKKSLLGKIIFIFILHRTLRHRKKSVKAILTYLVFLKVKHKTLHL